MKFIKLCRKRTKFLNVIAIIICATALICLARMFTEGWNLHDKNAIAMETHGMQPSKTILLWDPFFKEHLWWFEKNGSHIFHQEKCALKNCNIITDKGMANESEAILFHLRDFHDFPLIHPRSQVWMLFNMESPLNTGEIHHKMDFKFSWTISYRSTSHIFNPYAYLRNRNTGEPYHKKTTRELAHSRHKNMPDYTVGRNNKVVWFVSNCNTPSKRMEIAKELEKYIEVDIFGYCGRSDPCHRDKSCSRSLMRKYKFYLAFENSRCEEYITEKFWHCLEVGIVPIVLGARRDQYEKLVPPDSFISLEDFTSAKHLAKYLNYLDNNNTAYNAYFLWRETYTVAGQTWPFICQICAKLNEENVRISPAVKLTDLWSDRNCW